MYSGHQSCASFSVETGEMNFIGIRSFYQSHSFGQRVIETKDGFLYLSWGDCFDRAFAFSNVENVAYPNDGWFPENRSTLFDFWVEKDAYRRYDMGDLNETRARLGDITELSNGNIAFAARSVKSLGPECVDESKQIFIQIFDPDSSTDSPEDFATVGERSGFAGKNGDTPVTNYGVKWLTDYGNDVRVGSVQLASTDGEKIVVLYELETEEDKAVTRLYYTTYCCLGVYYIVLDKDGNVLIPETLLSENARLNEGESPVCSDGRIMWVGNRNYRDGNRIMTDDEIHIYSFDVLQLKY
jgi:hypothetical protein